MPESISRNWSRENIAWLAGILEGEGCFSISKSNARMIVCMTDEDVVRRVQEIAGCGSVVARKVVGGWKPTWAWTVGRAKYVLALGYAIYPLMGDRRRKKLEELIQKIISRKLPLNGSPHGSRSRYLRERCRCEKCCAVSAAYRKARGHK